MAAATPLNTKAGNKMSTRPGNDQNNIVLNMGAGLLSAPMFLELSTNYTIHDNHDWVSE